MRRNSIFPEAKNIMVKKVLMHAKKKTMPVYTVRMLFHLNERSDTLRDLTPRSGMTAKNWAKAKTRRNKIINLLFPCILDLLEKKYKIAYYSHVKYLAM